MKRSIPAVDDQGHSGAWTHWRSPPLRLIEHAVVERLIAVRTSHMAVVQVAPTGGIRARRVSMSWTPTSILARAGRRQAHETDGL